MSLHGLLRGWLTFYMYMIFVPHRKHLRASTACYKKKLYFSFTVAVLNTTVQVWWAVAQSV
jgi:hypothetical protein